MTDQEIEVSPKADLTMRRARVELARNRRYVFWRTISASLPKLWGDLLICSTAATDGRQIFFNPVYVESLSPSELVTVFIHEIMHVASKHHLRIEKLRDKYPHLSSQAFNVGADCCVNSTLSAWGHEIPEGGVLPSQFKFQGNPFPERLSFEQYMSLIDDSIKSGETPTGIGPDGIEIDGIPDCVGEVLPYDGTAKEAEIEERKISTKVARAAEEHSKAGTMTGGMEIDFSDMFQSRKDWRTELAMFAKMSLDPEYECYSLMDLRYLSRGLRLPGMIGRDGGLFAIVIDCSGSTLGDEVSMFIAEVAAIKRETNSKVIIIYHDVRVLRVDQFDEYEDVKFELMGGGGTSHVEAIEAASSYEPDCIVAFTDLYTLFPKEPPMQPLIWACTNRNHPDVPFGSVIVVDTVKVER
jgi:predicted metal-dependent peptidase